MRSRMGGVNASGRMANKARFRKALIYGGSQWEEFVLGLNEGTQRLANAKVGFSSSPHLNTSYASSITLTIPTENGGTIAMVAGERWRHDRKGVTED